jgi:hypothetical protein
MINAGQDLIFNQFGTGLTLLFQLPCTHSIHILSIIYLL